MMTARIGAPKTGGRKRGSIDREARKLLTDKMSADLMYCYTKLGGRAWLLEFAEKNPGEFIRQGLSRLWPAPQKDDSDFAVQNNQYNFDSSSTIEAARRVAFALNAGLHAQQELEQQSEPIEAVRDVTPVEPQGACDWQNPTPSYAPEPDPAKDLWIEELPLTEEQRRDNAVVRETREGSLATYRGGPGEQSGPGPDRQPSSRKPTVNEIRRRQLL